MSENRIHIGSRHFFPRSGLDKLIETLRKDGYIVLGPTVIDGTVSLRPIDSAADIPQGIQDDQDGGKYRLIEGNPDLNFEYVVGPDGPKRHFFPANLPLFQFHIEKNRFDLDARTAASAKIGISGNSTMRVGGHQGARPSFRHGRSRRFSL